MTRITDISIYYRSSGGGGCLVRIDTSDNVCGWGECSAMMNSAAAELVRAAIKPRLIGADPFQAARLEEAGLHKNYKFAGQLLGLAWAGVDIALWDLRGKLLGRPISDLMGGRYRDSVELYASSMSRDLSPEKECEKIMEPIERFGFNAVKIKVGPRFGSGADGLDLVADEAKVLAVRAAIGTRRKLLVDCNGSFTWFQAIDYFNRIKDCGIHQYEEPCPYHDIDSYLKLAGRIDAPINGGEQDWNFFTFRDYILRGAYQVAAADPVKAGISTCLRVATLCRAAGIVYSPHDTSRGIGLAACLHLAASQSECAWVQEYSIEKSAGTEEFLTVPFIPQEGRLAPPTAPGLGIEIDSERVEKTMSVLK